MQTRLLLNDFGALLAGGQLCEEARGRLLYEANGRVEHLHEEADAVQVFHDDLILKFFGEEQQSRRASFDDIEQIDVLYLDDQIVESQELLLLLLLLRSHLYLGVGVVQDLHELLDHAIGAQLVGVELIGAKVSHEAEQRLNARPRPRLRGHELRDYAQTVDGAHLLLS